MKQREDKMTVFKRFGYIALGFVIASLTVAMTGVGAQVSEGITRVLIANDVRDPIPIFSRDALEMRGEVRIDGEPKVKLDGDTKIKIESVEKPVTVQFEKNEEMPGTDIFKDGKTYAISFSGTSARRCRVDKIQGTWIFCKRKARESEMVGWVNTTQIAYVNEL